MELERRLSEGPLRVATLWTEEQTERLPQRVLLARRRRAIARGVAAVSAAAAVVAGLWLYSPLAAGPAAPVAANAAQSPGTRQFALSDGSQVSLLGAGSRVEVLEQTAALVRTQLGAGAARFDVRHDPARVFEVESGDVKVRVLGTAFSLTREGLLTRVAVERGAVRVQWGTGEAFLSAGQAGVYPPPEGAEAKADVVAEPLADLASGVAEEASSWRKLAKRGKYGDAYKAIGPASAKSVRDEPSDLMLAADVARLSRHPAEATRYLSRVVDGFPRDKRAFTAAFTLGRVLLEDLGQPARAADAFRRAQQLAPRGPLASDALAREADAAQRAGQADRARQAARRYVELYPNGPQAERLRKL
jgi:transmembrane sensor